MSFALCMRGVLVMCRLQFYANASCSGGRVMMGRRTREWECLRYRMLCRQLVRLAEAGQVVSVDEDGDGEQFEGIPRSMHRTKLLYMICS